MEHERLQGLQWQRQAPAQVLAGLEAAAEMAKQRGSSVGWMGV